MFRSTANWWIPVWSTLFDVFACVLAGDEEEVYWCCGRSGGPEHRGDGREGNYYHVEKGKGKRYIASNLPEPGEQDFDTAVKKLKRGSRQRRAERNGGKARNEEEKRRKRLEEIRDALPFRMGMKWGLKLGERIMCLPNTEIFFFLWAFIVLLKKRLPVGVMALDGKVVVEARYQKVDIEKNGTVHLTIIPGKVQRPSNCKFVSFASFAF